MILFPEDNIPLIWKFMHDNDPKQTSRLVKSCLEENNITVLKWPAQSLELNPIENLWNNVEEHVRAVQPKNLNDLWKEIQKAWYTFPTTLYDNSRKLLCCTAVIQNKGFPSKYYDFFMKLSFTSVN